MIRDAQITFEKVLIFKEPKFIKPMQKEDYSMKRNCCFFFLYIDIIFASFIIKLFQSYTIIIEVVKYQLLCLKMNHPMPMELPLQLALRRCLEHLMVLWEVEL